VSFLLLVSLKRGGGSGSTEDPAHIPQSPVQHVALQGSAGESERMEVKNSKGRRLSTIERLVDTHDASAVQRESSSGAPKGSKKRAALLGETI
jgi:hypothetical protein